MRKPIQQSEQCVQLKDKQNRIAARDIIQGHPVGKLTIETLKQDTGTRRRSGVVLVSLLLILNIFQALSQCYYCQLWACNWRLGSGDGLILRQNLRRVQACWAGSWSGGGGFVWLSVGWDHFGLVCGAVADGGMRDGLAILCVGSVKRCI